MSETSILFGVQSSVVDRLEADPYFSNVPVVAEVKGDIENQIDIALKQLGVVAIVVTPLADVTRTVNAPGPYFDAINVVVRVCENVILNRGVGGIGKPSLEVAEHVLALLHLYKPDGINEAFYAVTPTIALVPDPNGLITYDVSLRTQGGIKFSIPVVADPVITNTSDGYVTITTATPHASIFYTVDGSFPNPRNSTFFDIPFQATVGTVVRARAWMPGYISSKVVGYTVTSTGSAGGALASTARIKDGNLQMLCLDNSLWYNLDFKLVDGVPVLSNSGNGEV